MRRRLGPESAVALAFAVWVFIPLAVLFVHFQGGLHIGSDGRLFTGADHPDVPDQLQYLSWIRDAGHHALFSNRFDLRPDPHLFLHPVFALSGLAWDLGVSLQLAFLAWKPIWAAALVVGFWAYVRRLVDSRWARAAALFLALFLFAPATPVYDWLGLGGATLNFGLLTMGLEAFPAGYLAGAGALAVGLMPVFLLGIERLVEGRPRPPAPPDPSRPRTRAPAWYMGGTAVAGALVSWLHPWQGITLLVLVPATVAWARRWERWRALVPPLVATALPLAYYFVLSRTDSSWQQVARTNNFPHFGAWLYLTMVPFVLLAAPGWPGRGLDFQQRIVRLWPVVAFAEYLALHSSWIYHAFVGISLPLAILAVNGWRRAGGPREWIPAPLGALVAAAAIAIVTLPGTFYYLQRLQREAPQHFVVSPEASALRFLARARSGGVLARVPLGTAVPAFTDQRTWVGHPTWTPYYGARVAAADALFSGRLSAARAQAFVHQTGARFVLADCGAPADLTKLLGPMLASARRFGCAAVYEVAAPGPPT